MLHLIERDDATRLLFVVLFPVVYVSLDQSLVQSNDPLEQVDRLLAVVDFSRGELVH